MSGRPGAALPAGFFDLLAARETRFTATPRRTKVVHLALGIAERTMALIRHEPHSKERTMRKTLLAIAAATLTLPAAPALADPPSWAPANGWRAKQEEQRRYYTTDNGIRYWRGEDGRNYCRRSNGTTGLLIGGAAGALAGRAIDTRGERTTGTILGAAAGALLGREVERRASCR
jgi:outer membrane lipoprotein SlyB